MTKEERLIVGAYTGALMTDFSDLHEFIEKRLGRPIWTHELADKNIQEELKESVREDFLKLCEDN